MSTAQVPSISSYSLFYGSTIQSALWIPPSNDASNDESNDASNDASHDESNDPSHDVSNDESIETSSVISIDNNSNKLGDFYKNRYLLRYSKFIKTIAYEVTLNSDLISHKILYLNTLFPKKYLTAYFKYMCVKQKDYDFWKRYGLEPPMVELNNIIPDWIGINCYSPYRIFFYNKNSKNN